MSNAPNLLPRGIAPKVLASLYEGLPEGLCFIDGDLRYVMINERLAAINGHPVEAHIGRKPSDMLGDFGREIEAVCLQILDVRVPRLDWQCDGPLILDQSQPRHLLIDAIPVFDDGGAPLGLSVIVKEVTEKKRIEEWSRALFEMAPISMTIVDTKTTGYVQFNTRAHEMRGYTREEFAQLRVADLEPSYSPAQLNAIHLALSSSGQPIQFESRQRRKDGSLFDVLVSLTPVTVGDQSFVYGMHVDISEMKIAQRLLTEAKAEAERANSAKSRFLAAASHDLRQPLQALNLYLGVLSSKISPDGGVVMGHIERCVSSLSELLNDLLDLSKLDAGVVSPKPGAVGLGSLLSRVISSHGPTAATKALRLRMVDTQLTAHTDPVLLERMVSNFVDNAIRYTTNGGVVVGCRRHLGKTWIEVWDSGMGIPADKTGEIFEEFRQLGNHERSREKGTGLGLAIVAKTADLLGLHIRVKSRLGVGSMFAVEVPLGPL